MATAAVTPSAPAAAPASAPAAAPSPAPSSAAPETGAQPVAAPVAPAAPAATELQPAQLSGEEQIQPNEGESNSEYMARVMKARLDAAKAKPAEDEVKPPEVKTDGEQPKPAEPAKPAEAPKVEEKKEPTGEYEDAFELNDEDLTLQPAEAPKFVGPVQLAQLAKDHPEFGKALESLPAAERNQLYQTLRHFERGKDILEKFPTPKFADFAIESTRQLATFRDGFIALNGEKSDEAFQGIVQSLLKESQLAGEDGQPLKDPVSGRVLTDGTFERFVDGMGNLWLKGFEGLATATDDAELKAALNVVREKMKAPPSRAEDDVPEHVKAREAEVKTAEESLRRQQSEAMRQERTTTEKKLGDQVNSLLDKRIDKILSKVEIPDFNREHATRDIRSEVMKRVTSNKDFVAQRDFLSSQPQTQDVKRQRMELFADTVQLYLVPVANDILARAGASKKQQIAAAREKSTALQEASRNEPRGGGAQPTPQGVPQGEAAMVEWENNFMKQEHRVPTTNERMKFLMKQKGVPGA
jgi:hypothetical protein